jgi:hypothetical protein
MEVNTHRGEGKLQHVIEVGPHRLLTDAPVASGGEATGPEPHDLLAAALAASTAPTVTMYAKRKGPFVFLDQLGPHVFSGAQGLDVRPHPHIGLATVTYLLDGEIVHRDSLRTVQSIRPGEVNWMTAGSGILHSERTAPEARSRKSRIEQAKQDWKAQVFCRVPGESEFIPLPDLPGKPVHYP